VELISRSDLGLEVEDGFNQTVARFKTEAGQMVGDFEPIVAARPECKPVIRDEMPKALSRILASLTEADGQLSLLTFGLSQSFHVRLIPFAFDLLARFGGINDAACQNVQVEAEVAARKCLDAFVWNRRRMLSALIAQGMTGTDWLDGRSPREASISISLILQELAYIWRQVEWITNKVGGGEGSSSHGSRSSRTKYSGYSGSAFNSSQGPLFSGLRDDNVHQIDRYFTTINQLHLRKTTEFSSKAILTAICMFAVKTLLEYVRSSTFSSSGFNQMQIDSYFIYQSVFDKVTDVNLFNALIEEVLSSAADRTFEPIPLKLAVLANMYSQWGSKAQTETE
jgi:hypothetical protein